MRHNSPLLVSLLCARAGYRSACGGAHSPHCYKAGPLRGPRCDLATPFCRPARAHTVTGGVCDLLCSRALSLSLSLSAVSRAACWRVDCAVSRAVDWRRTTQVHTATQSPHPGPAAKTHRQLEVQVCNRAAEARRRLLKDSSDGLLPAHELLSTALRAAPTVARRQRTSALLLADATGRRCARGKQHHHLSDLLSYASSATFMNSLYFWSQTHIAATSVAFLRRCYCKTGLFQRSVCLPSCWFTWLSLTARTFECQDFRSVRLFATFAIQSTVLPVPNTCS